MFGKSMVFPLLLMVGFFFSPPLQWQWPSRPCRGNSDQARWYATARHLLGRIEMYLPKKPKKNRINFLLSAEAAAATSGTHDARSMFNSRPARVDGQKERERERNFCCCRFASLQSHKFLLSPFRDLSPFACQKKNRIWKKTYVASRNVCLSLSLSLALLNSWVAGPLPFSTFFFGPSRQSLYWLN